MAWILHRQIFSWAPVTWRIQTASAHSCLHSSLSAALTTAAFSHQHHSQLHFPTPPMGVQLPYPQTRLKNIPILLFCCFGPCNCGVGPCNCDVLWEPSAEFTPFLAFPPSAVGAAGAGAFLPMAQQLKVTANFSARFYPMLRIPLRRFFLCYLQMLLYWFLSLFFSEGLKIPAVTLKSTEIIDYLVLPPLQLFTSCPSVERGCAISRWFSVKESCAELQYQCI